MKLARLAPSIVLAILVCTIATAVEHFIPPDAGLQINRASPAIVAQRFHRPAGVPSRGRG